MKQHFPYIIGLIWVGLVSVGLWTMVDYENTPGSTIPPPKIWPKKTTFMADTRHPTLLMFIHPHCPCSKASVGELARIATVTQDRLSIIVAFIRPKGFDDVWVKSSLWQSASRIPNVQMFVDPEGQEARLFGATLSGQVFLYHSNGTNLFQGGITSSRGHAGDSIGRSTILNAVLEQQTATTQSFAFGCALF